MEEVRGGGGGGGGRGGVRTFLVGKPKKILEEFNEETSSDELPLLLENPGSSVVFGSMEHCHGFEERRLADVKDARKKLLFACGLCGVFVGSEILGGLLSSSLAILTDAAHMFSDFASFIVALWVIELGSKAPRKSFNFGYYRAEALGALFTVSVIWYITGILLYLAGTRLHSMDFEVEPNTMMIVAGIAVIFNIILGFVFHGHPFSHSHQRDKNTHEHINIRAAFIHVLGDFIQSIGVFISSIIIKIWPDYKAVDPLCTIFFSVVVFCTTINILKDTLRILMEGTPKNMSYDEISKDILETSTDIVQVHDLCLWSLTTDRAALSAHVAVDPSNRDSDETLLNEIIKALRKKYKKLTKITVQIEDYRSVMDDCDNCQSLK